MAHSVVEFEATKRKEFRSEEFYKQFKTCLPKMVMVSQGFRGTSSEDTFDLGEVIVIIGKAKDVFRTEHKAIKACIEGRYMIEGDISENPVYLPLNEPDLLIAEVTGIKGQSKEQWVSFQKFVTKRITGTHDDTEQHDDDHEYETSVVRETKKPKWHRKFISLVRESITNLEERFTETLHSSLPAKSRQSSNVGKISRKSPTLNAPKKIVNNIRALYKEPQTTETPNYKNVKVQNHEYKNHGFHSKMTDMSTEEEGSDPDYETYYENHCSWNPENTRKNSSSTDNNYSKETTFLKPSTGQVSSTLASKIEATPISRMTSLHKTKKPPVIATKPTVKPINLSLPIVEVKRLSMEEVGKYLKLLNLAMYVDIFRENLIDGQMLFSLDKELLTTDLKMNDEEARKLIQFAKTGEMPHS